MDGYIFPQVVYGHKNGTQILKEVKDEKDWQDIKTRKHSKRSAFGVVTEDLDEIKCWV